MCSIYQLERNLKDVSDEVLTKCFYDTTFVSNGITPILGWLCGYDEYPPIPDNAPLMSVLNGRRERLKLEPYEFECFVRLYLVAGNIIINNRAHRLIKLLPLVLTYVRTRATLGVEVDKCGVDMITKGDGAIIQLESVKSDITEAVEEDHRENIEVIQSLLSRTV